MNKKVVFMGTPEFAVESLRRLVDQNITVCAVVTIADKPAGRGQQLNESPVKIYAKNAGIPILQPISLKDESFLSALKSFNADLFVVVAFRMLPEVVWSMPPLGTINLHGSLLPQYRGAAPINWAVMNGDTETGATTFFIEKEIDTGKIIDRVTIPISETDDAGNVHDRLMVSGADLLAKTVNAIFDGTVKAVDQNFYTEGVQLKAAPKIFKDDCKLNWSDTTNVNYNKIRGLSPYPAAWTVLEKDGQHKSLKLFKAKKQTDGVNRSSEVLLENGKILFGCADGFLEIEELQLEGKKRLRAIEFMNGFNLSGWKLVQ